MPQFSQLEGENQIYTSLALLRQNELWVRRSVHQGGGPGRCQKCKGQAKISLKCKNTQTDNPDKGKAICKQIAETGGKVCSHSVLFSYLEVWATAKPFRKQPSKHCCQLFFVDGKRELDLFSENTPCSRFLEEAELWFLQWLPLTKGAGSWLQF